MNCFFVFWFWEVKREYQRLMSKERDRKIENLGFRILLIPIYTSIGLQSGAQFNQAPHMFTGVNCLLDQPC